MRKISDSIKLWLLKSILTVSFSSLALSASAPDIKFVYISVPERVNAYDRLINAVVSVESAGDTFAYNLLEEAAGAFQIRPIRLLDYYRRTGISYQTIDCYNYDISREIFLYYAILTGHRDYEKIAKNWNGSGKMTFDYWEKVKANL